ncbi:Di-copper centre-containing protein [Daldinia eschscholtzii]|nr:Di-copper centre-containing protein [Daldinia eschscholtzii]
MTSSAEYYPIVGIQDGLDPEKDKLLREVPLRMELDDWFTSKESIHVNQRALFFPAVWKFSQMDPREKLSWFQIAGIHGMPFVSWDEPGAKPETEKEGYCTHNSILFCTWHRPYLLLFEQVIFEHMKEEINKYPEEDKPALKEAARTWRFPYWDWALKKPIDGEERRDYNVPLAILNKTVHIRQPANELLVPYENALYQFTMPNRIAMGDWSLKSEDQDLRVTEVVDEEGKIYPFQYCQATSRHPRVEGADADKDWISGKQDNEAIVKKMRDWRYKGDKSRVQEYQRKGNTTASLRGAFSRVLGIEKFEDFATKRAPGSGADKPDEKVPPFDSGENIHDLMHVMCGGDGVRTDRENIYYAGHMSHVPVAAFDPIFWFHHCNVDRMIAIWQMLHDDSWFDPNDIRNEDNGTYSIKRGHMDKPDDPLRPFHKEGGQYWTSSDVREVTALGYTYPGLEKWKYTTKGVYDKKKHTDEIKERNNKAYGSDWSAVQKSRLTADPGESAGFQLASRGGLGGDPIDLTVDDYVVNVIYEKFELNGNPFEIHIFIGKVPDEAQYGSGITYVGEVVNFSTEPRGLGISDRGCENCQIQRANHTRSTGRVALTNSLITRWKNQIQHENSDGGPPVLRSMKPEDVVLFLTSNLHWRVTSMGALVNLSSLRVSLAVGEAKHFADRTKMSIYHKYKPAYEVTRGRRNGAGPEDHLYPEHLQYISPSAA